MQPLVQDPCPDKTRADLEWDRLTLALAARCEGEMGKSLARDLGPRGIHVAWISIDGVIDVPGVRERYAQLGDRELLKPEAIADTFFFIAHQDRSAWTNETEIVVQRSIWELIQQMCCFYLAKHHQCQRRMQNNGGSGET